MYVFSNNNNKEIIMREREYYTKLNLGEVFITHIHKDI